MNSVSNQKIAFQYAQMLLPIAGERTNRVRFMFTCARHLSIGWLGELGTVKSFLFRWQIAIPIKIDIN